MASVTIRNLPDDVKERLRVRAAQHGFSLEQELRATLIASASDDRRPISDRALDWPDDGCSLPVVAIGEHAGNMDFRREDLYD